MEASASEEHGEQLRHYVPAQPPSFDRRVHTKDTDVMAASASEEQGEQLRHYGNGICFIYVGAERAR
eukprot:6577203-Pyramimonas_sp.AAC.1